MNCLYCHKSLQTAVLFGGKEYQRAKGGCCPHCAVKLPHNISIQVGNRDNHLKSYRIISSFEVSESAKKSKWMRLGVFGAALTDGVCWAMTGIEGGLIVVGIIFGILYMLIMSLFGFIWYDANIYRGNNQQSILNRQKRWGGPEWYTEQDIHTGKAL